MGEESKKSSILIPLQPSSQLEYPFCGVFLLLLLTTSLFLAFLNRQIRAASGHYQMGRGFETGALVLPTTGNFQIGVGHGECTRLAETVS